MNTLERTIVDHNRFKKKESGSKILICYDDNQIEIEEVCLPINDSKLFYPYMSFRILIGRI